MHGAVCNFQPFKTINDHTYTFFSGSACPRWLDRHNIRHHGHVNTARDTVRTLPHPSATAAPRLQCLDLATVTGVGLTPHAALSVARAG